MPIDVSQVMIGAVAAGVGSAVVNIIKSRLDIYAARYEEACKQISAVADLASEYWLMKVSSSTDEAADKDQRMLHDKAQLFEARIEGFQQLVLMSDEELRVELPHSARDKIAVLLPDFIDTLTGGEFKARTGSAQTVSASLVQYNAANLVSTIRGGLRKKYTFGHIIKRTFHQH